MTNPSEQEELESLDVLLKDNPEVSEVIESDPEVLEAVKRSPKLQQALIQISHSQHFSGPLPPPSILVEYEKLVPGISRELFDGVRNDTHHIHTMQKTAIEAQKRDNLLGQIFGFSIGVIAILSGTYAAVNGAPTAGGIIGGTAVAGIVAVFVLGRKSKSNSSEE